MPSTDTTRKSHCSHIVVPYVSEAARWSELKLVQEALQYATIRLGWLKFTVNKQSTRRRAELTISNRKRGIVHCSPSIN